ncbi:MAG: PA0069 family radical SAM protein [Gemmataceae bacterium]
MTLPTPRGRGTGSNPPNRFIPLYYDPDPDCPPDEAPAPTTQFFRDSVRTIISTTDSPDVGFTHSVNPYRGCEHGCSYCYARPYHEYLGLSAGLDFETKIFVKEDAPALLRKELSAKSWTPTPLSFSGVTDCYQPAERHYCVTRRCLEVCAEFRNPAGVITKNALVTRDLDVLAAMAEWHGGEVFFSVTTLDADLAGTMEPRASRPAARLDAIAKCAAAGVPVGVMAAPMIPGLNDHELPAILKAARDAGATWAGFTLLRLPMAVGDVFDGWLAEHYPERRDKVMGRVRDARGGRLNDSRFGHRMRGQGELSETLRALFHTTAARLGYAKRLPPLSTAHFRRPGERTLFD